MAVVEITLSQDSLNRDGTSSLTRQYVIEFDTIEVSSEDCVGATDGIIIVPGPDSLESYTNEYGTTVYMRIKSWSAQPSDASPFVYIVDVEWSNDADEPDDGEDLVFNVEVSITGVKVTEPTFEDKDGNPIRNTAGDAYEDGVNKDHHYEQLNISFNTRKTYINTVSTAIENCRDKVNDAEITFGWEGLTKVYAARELKMIEGDYSYDNGTDTWKVNLSFQIFKGGWKNRLLSQGYYQLVVVAGVSSSSSTKRVPCVDDNNQPMQTPALLNSSGAQTTTPYYKTEEIEEETNQFTTLFTGIIF